MERVNDNSYNSFGNIFLNALDVCASLKAKMLRFNNSAFMTKKLRKEIMRRLKLRNQFNMDRNHENWCKHKTKVANAWIFSENWKSNISTI